MKVRGTTMVALLLFLLLLLEVLRLHLSMAASVGAAAPGVVVVFDDDVQICQWLVQQPGAEAWCHLGGGSESWGQTDRRSKKLGGGSRMNQIGFSGIGVWRRWRVIQVAGAQKKWVSNKEGVPVLF